MKGCSVSKTLSVSSIKCPGCKKNGFARFLEKAGRYDLFICDACTLTFSRPMQQAKGDFYELNAEYEDKWEFGAIYHKIIQLGLRGAILDIGCGDGRFMEMMKEQFAVTGIDINRGAVKVAREKRNLNDTFPTTLKEHISMFPARKYDVITAFHTLEHVEDPAEFIADMRQSLKPHGAVAISIPNPNRWTLRWTRELWDYPPHHLTRWTTGGLCSLLESCGLNIIDISYERVSTLGQIKSAMLDIIWACVLKKFSFKVILRMNLNREEPDFAKTNAFRTNLKAFLNALCNLKGMAIKYLAFSLALITLPVLWLRCLEGKSLLVLARLED